MQLWKYKQLSIIQFETNDGINKLSTKAYFSISKGNLNPVPTTIQCH